MFKPRLLSVPQVPAPEIYTSEFKNSGLGMWLRGTAHAYLTCARPWVPSSVPQKKKKIKTLHATLYTTFYFKVMGPAYSNLAYSMEDSVASWDDLYLLHSNPPNNISLAPTTY
jgi:hypothetical protein